MKKLVVTIRRAVTLFDIEESPNRVPARIEEGSYSIKVVRKNPFGEIPLWTVETAGTTVGAAKFVWKQLRKHGEVTFNVERRDETAR